MSSPSQVAAGFTITGLLDGASRTRGRYPVSEIAVADIADHPANAAYSMDPAGIAELAESIREDGLTDLPLVRKVGDGSWQMVSGHRRKAAYALLAKDDPAYERMPCRVIEGIDDERAVTLLHAANYFTRALTVTERAAATEALRGDAVRLRSEDPSLSGMRVDDVKAAIIERQTGRKVSGKTIAREERLARRIAEDLSPEWAAEADRGNLSAEAVRSLAGMPKERQAEMHAAMEPWRRTKRELSDYVRSESETQAGPDGRIAKARPARPISITVIHSSRSWLPSGAAHSAVCAMVPPIFPCGTARAHRTAPCPFSSARRLNRLMSIGEHGGSGDGSRWVELVVPSRNGHEPRALARG